MPIATGAKYHYLDHDTATVLVAPPVQNFWYEVFHDYDVRLFWCAIIQTNAVPQAQTIEVRWTIDGNVYLGTTVPPSASLVFAYRTWDPSTAGTLGLSAPLTQQNGAWYVDKRGQDFKVEIRMTSAPAAAQTLRCDCVYETLEPT